MAAVSGVYNVIKSTAVISTAITTHQVGGVAGVAAEVYRNWCNQSTITSTAQTRISFLLKSGAATVTGQSPALLSPAMQASKLVSGATASGVTATIEGTDSTVWDEEGFNIVNGWLYLPVPEERNMTVNRILAMKFMTAPTSASYITGTGWLEYAG
jgi:hypothetical protein